MLLSLSLQRPIPGVRAKPALLHSIKLVTAPAVTLAFSICSMVPPSGASLRLPAGLQGLRVSVMPLVRALQQG